MKRISILLLALLTLAPAVLSAQPQNGNQPPRRQMQRPRGVYTLH